MLPKQLMGFTALNQYAAHESPSRGAMFLMQWANHVSLTKPDARVVFSGLEGELVKANMHTALPEDAMILDIIDRVSPNGIVLDTTIIYLAVEKNEINAIEVKRYDKFDKHFSFEHRQTDVMKNIDVGDVLKKGTQLTRTNSEVHPGVYGFGLRTNVLSITDKIIAEDAVVISESYAERSKFKLIETVTFSFGGDKVPVNLYGDDEEYKILPDIGEHISDTNIVAAIRDANNEEYLIRFQGSNIGDPDPTFDDIVIAKGSSGIVKDIRVINTRKPKSGTYYTNTEDQVAKYADMDRLYRQKFVSSVDHIMREYPNVKIGGELHVAYVNYTIIDDDRVKNTYKQADLDTWRIEVDIEYEVKPYVGMKFTTIHGAKGIVSEIRPDDQMDVDKNGLRADMLIDSASVISRMNIGGKYEGYFQTAAIVAQQRVIAMVKEFTSEEDPLKGVNKLTEEQQEQVFKYILGLIEMFGNEQYEMYQKANSTMKKEILKEAVSDAIYIYLPIDNSVSQPEIARRIMESEYAISEEGLHGGQGKGYIESQYVMLLYKIADTWLSSASTRVNVFNVPVSPSKSKKQMVPYNATPPKILSESETRKYAAFINQQFVAELRDRSNNIRSQYMVNDAILKAEKPTAIPKAIDREKHPYGDDNVLKMIKTIYRTGGVDVIFNPEEENEK